MAKWVGFRVKSRHGVGETGGMWGSSSSLTLFRRGRGREGVDGRGY